MIRSLLPERIYSLTMGSTKSWLNIIVFDVKLCTLIVLSAQTKAKVSHIFPKAISLTSHPAEILELFGNLILSIMISNEGELVKESIPVYA